MELAYIILSTTILALSMSIGVITSAYAFVLLVRWRHMNVRNYHFLLNLVISCFLASAFIVPGQMASILHSTSGGEASSLCIILLLFTKIITSETMVNMALMVLYQVYVMCIQVTMPSTFGMMSLIMVLPWSSGIAYGVVTSLLLSSTSDGDVTVDPTKACRIWEMVNLSSLPGEGVRKMDRILLILSLAAQVIGYIAIGFQLKHSQHVVRPYELDRMPESVAPEIEEQTVEMEKEINIGPLPRGSLKAFPLVRQSSISRRSCVEKTSTQRDKKMCLRRASSMREISTDFGAIKNSRILTRGLSETDVTRMLPGYIHDEDNRPMAKSSEAAQDTVGYNRYVHHWKKLQAPSKSTSSAHPSEGAGNDVMKCKKDQGQPRGCRLGVGDIKDSSESSMSIGSFRTSGTSNYCYSSNGTFSPYGLKLPGTNRSGSFQSFSTSISSEAMSGSFRPVRMQRINPVTEAWIIDNNYPAGVTLHDASTSTNEIEDLLDTRQNPSMPEQSLVPTSSQKSSYTDAWKRMSAQTRSTLGSAICHDPLSTLEKIKQWRTASVDCSTIITSDLEESAFFDLCYATEMQDGGPPTENIRSVSQICPQESVTNINPSIAEEEEATNKAPIEIRVIRPSASSATVSFENRLLKRKTGLINQNTNFPEAIKERNSGSTEASYASIQDACYDADAEEGEGDPKTSIPEAKLPDRALPISIVQHSGEDNAIRKSQHTKTQTSSNSSNSTPITQVTKMSQANFRPFLGRPGSMKKLVRLNSHRNMRVTQVSSHHLPPRPAVIPEERPVVRKVVFWIVMVVVVTCVLLLPTCFYASSSVLEEGEVNTIIILECIPFIWFALAPFLYVIFKRESPNSWHA